MLPSYLQCKIWHLKIDLDLVNNLYLILNMEDHRGSSLGLELIDSFSFNLIVNFHHSISFTKNVGKVLIQRVDLRLESNRCSHSNPT